MVAFDLEEVWQVTAIDVHTLEQWWEWLSSLSPQWVLVTVFVVLFLAGCGFIIPEDVPLTFTGIMLSVPSFRAEYGGTLPALLVVALVVYSSILTGDLVAYFYGYKLGTNASRIPILKFVLRQEKLDRLQAWFERWGNWAVFWGRMAAGVRMATFVTAGAAKMPVRKFVLFDSLAALVTVPFWISVGYFVGAHFKDILLWMRRARYATLVVVCLVLGVIITKVLLKRMLRKRKNNSASSKDTQTSVHKAQPQIDKSKFARL